MIKCNNPFCYNKNEFGCAIDFESLDECETYQYFKEHSNSGGNAGYASPASSGVQNGGSLQILKEIIPEPYDELLKICSKSHTITLSEIDTGIIIKAVQILKNNR